jgi:hypothetical protein
VILPIYMLLVLLQPEDPARIRIGPNVAVNKDEPLKMHTKVVLAVNPVDSRNLIAASNRSWGDAKTKACIVLVHASQDAGGSWETLPLEAERGSYRGDPDIVFGPDGTAYLVTIAVGATGTIASSKDKGRTWQKAFNASTGDHSRLALDPRNGHLYVVFANNGGKVHELKWAVSTDGAKSFGPRTKLQGLGSETEWVLALNRPWVLSDGTLFLPVRREDEKQDYGLKSTFDVGFVTSRDGGRTFTSFKRIVALPCPWDVGADREAQRRTFREGFYRKGLNARRSSYTVPRFAYDPAGVIYLVWEQSESLDADPGRLRTHVWLTKSRDSGASWSPPKRVDPLAPAASRQGMAQVAVSSEGTVGVAWIDTRSHAEDGPFAFDLWFAASIDRAETFLPSVKVSDQTSKPDFVNKLPYAWNWDLGWGALGDETDLVAGGPGRTFHFIWPDSRTGIAQIMYAQGEVPKN